MACNTPNIQEEINRFLQTLAQASAAEFGNDFPKLTLGQQFRLLEKLEKNQTAAFSSFVNYVYESYYTRPQVLGLLWCAPPAPPVENDGELLAPVRKLTHLYKDECHRQNNCGNHHAFQRLKKNHGNVLPTRVFKIDLY